MSELLHFMDCDGEDPCSCDRELALFQENENQDLNRWESEGGGLGSGESGILTFERERTPEGDTTQAEPSD